jgi:hypothetical protein
MMTRGQFYSECCRRATHGAFRKVEITSTVAALIGGVLGQLLPSLGKDIAMSLWLVPLIVGVVVFLVAWTLAPYAMYRENERTKSESIATLQERIETKTSRIDLIPLLVIAVDRLTHAIEDGKPRPNAGAITAVYPSSDAEAVTKFKSEICAVINGANSILEQHQFKPLDIDEFSSANDFRAVSRLAETRRAALQTIIEKL